MARRVAATIVAPAGWRSQHGVGEALVRRSGPSCSRGGGSAHHLFRRSRDRVASRPRSPRCDSRAGLVPCVWARRSPSSGPRAGPARPPEQAAAPGRRPTGSAATACRCSRPRFAPVRARQSASTSRAPAPSGLDRRRRRRSRGSARRSSASRSRPGSPRGRRTRSRPARSARPCPMGCPMAR